MRIGIDVRYLSHGLMGGVHTYTAHLVSALIKAAPQHAFFLYADTKRPFELTDLPDNTTVRYLPYRNGLSSVYNDWFMKRKMELDALDVAHFPANYGFGPKSTRTIITLHDQINIVPWTEIIRGHRKQLRTIGMMTYLHLCTIRALNNAQYIITVSNYSKSKIVEHSTFDPQRIIPVIYPPSPTVRRIEDPAVLNDVRKRYSLTKSFILADAIKNPAALVNAWKLLPEAVRHDRQIVFFSRTPAPPEVVHEAETAGFARLLVRPPNEDLMALYSMAEAFIFPSWIEGLGLPLLEAMTCGAPVIASDRGSIPEVTSDAALLSDVDDVQGIARNIVRVLTSSLESERLRQLGFARAAELSWPRTAQRVLDVYEQALAIPTGGESSSPQ